jgi:murein DD-endopeptidase MepM/ murein hydrolase activator NlpD
VDALWKDNFLTDLSERKKTVASVYGVANGEFLWPLDSSHNTSTSVFGPRIRTDTGARENHNGVDFGASANSPVYAVCDGTVTDAHYSSSAGNMVTITTELDGHTLELTFMHNNSFVVKAGDKVTQGQVIAYAGSTGDSTGVHCHLKLLVDGVSTNPLLYLYGSLSQIPAIDSDGNLTYIDVISNPGSWSTAAGTEWNTYISIENGVAVKYQQ